MAFIIISYIRSMNIHDGESENPNNKKSRAIFNYMANNMNVTVGANFDLLKTNLSAVFEKNELGSKILLLPTKVDSPTSVTLGEMIADFKQAFGIGEESFKKEIETKLSAAKKEGSTFNASAITFQLKSAFLYKNMPKQEKQPAEGGQTTGETEYAFAISVDMSDALPDLGFVKLNSLYLAVWNTERKAVLQQIGTGDITKMLSNLSA